MLAWCSSHDNNLVPFVDILPAPALCDKIDRLGGASEKNDLVGGWGIEEAAYFRPRFLISVSGPRCQFVCCAVDVGIFVLVEVRKTIDHGLWLLRGGGILL